MVRNDILQKFPDLFGAKKVNGRNVNVDEAITTLTRELAESLLLSARAGSCLSLARPFKKSMAGRNGRKNLRILLPASSGLGGRSCKPVITTFWDVRASGAGVSTMK